MFTVERFSPSGPIAQLTVSVIAEAANQAMIDGSVVFELATRSWWVYRFGSSLALDADTVVAAVGGQFLRLSTGHPSWLFQYNWFVSSAGSNKNDGASASTPLATISEIVRRLGPAPIMSGGDLTINVLTSLSETPLRIDVRFLTDHGIRILGAVQSAIYSGSFAAAYVAPAKAGSQRSQITDAAVGDFTTFGYQRARMLSGAQSGATANIIKRTAATVAFTSSFLNISPIAALPSTVPAIVSPANGDQYQLDQLPILNGLSVTVRKPGLLTGRAPLIVDSIEFSASAYPVFEVQDGPVVTASIFQRGLVTRCVFRSSFARSRNISYQGCIWASSMTPVALGDWHLWGCAVMGFSRLPLGTQSIDVSGLTIFQGGNNNAGGIAVPGSDSPGLLTVNGNIGRIVSTNFSGSVAADIGFGLFDSRSSSALNMVTGSTLNIQGTNSIIYGTGNSGAGINVQRGALIAYDSGAEPTVTGASDTTIAGVTVPYTLIPLFDAQNAAGIVGGA